MRCLSSRARILTSICVSLPTAQVNVRKKVRAPKARNKIRRKDISPLQGEDIFGERDPGALPLAITCHAFSVKTKPSLRARIGSFPSKKQ